MFSMEELLISNQINRNFGFYYIVIFYENQDKREACFIYWFFKELVNLSRILPCDVQILYLQFVIQL